MYDVISFLRDNKIRTKTSGTNVSEGWVEIHCPFPLCRDPSEHMGINLTSSTYNCWKCGEHGPFTKLVSVLLRCGWNKAEAIASEYFKPSLVTDRNKPIERDRHKFAFPKEATEKLPRLHREYLISRGFDPKYLQREYQIMACYETGKYSYRIIIPIFMFNRPVSFTARDVTGERELRYKNMPNEESIIPTKQCVYGIDEVEDTILIVEGIFVKWKFGKGCVATLGTKFTPTQVKAIISKKPKSAFIMYDLGAEKEAEKLSYVLSPHINHVELLGTDDYDDYDDMSEKDVKHLRKEIGL